ncbi:MAG: methionine--tRNA ligase [Pseudomonas sp.]|uniref:methionine--tRNA ligase n=1 Tax=Pseudomonas sp. TaxID=306 RepID=UPI003D11AAE1
MSEVTAKQYLLVPAMPAPNGRLHLGHVAGPYLNLDILARHLRREGHRASIVCASDPFDSYIPLRAQQADVDPASLAQESCAGIINDLAYMNIQVDLFVDPLDPEHREQYLAAHVDLVDRLSAQGQVSCVEEQMPWSTARQTFVSGSFLTGHCPQCDQAISGFFCEDCGAHFEPDQVRAPRARWGEEVPARALDNLFFQIREPQALLAQLQATQTPDPFIDIARRHLRRLPARVRVTNHAGWGLPYQLDGQARTLFGHGLLFGAVRFVGDCFARATGLAQNPFDRDSPVITVNGFGIDNSVSHLVSIQAMAMADGLSKPFEHFLINHFYTLEGRKFSTSLGWAVWVEDMAREGRVPCDALRYFLASTSPIHQRTDFTRQDFEQFLNGRYAGLIERVNTALGSAAKAAAVDAPVMAAFDAAYAEQAQALTFASFDPQAVSRSIAGWEALFASLADDNSRYWWLKGLAVLACPLLPTLAQSIWHRLGQPGEVSVQAFKQQRRAATRAVSNGQLEASS